MKSFILLLALLATTFASVQQQFDCTGNYNNQTLIDSPPQLVQSVPNGNKYIIQNNNATALYILALNGSWYDIGKAYGQLMKAELADGLPGMFDYLANQTDVVLNILKDDLPFFLKWIPNLLELDSKQLMGALLGLLHEITSPYTPQRYKDQLQGIADGSGVDLTLLTNLNLLPDLIKAQCSMAGIWGSASYDSKLIQLRALDWDFQAYIVRYPTVAVYFSEEEGSNPFSTFGFAGMIGAISGYSPKIALSEKAWLPSSTNAKQRFGQPFPYVLRDMLQFGNDLESSVGVLFNASRTCQIYVGIGSRADNSFEGCRVSFEALDIYNDKNFTNYTSNHPQMDGVMFWDKHTTQPSNNTCIGGLLQENLGKIDPEYMFRTVTALDETGDTQVVVYQFENSTVYVAYSDPVNQLKAYTRPLIKLDMGSLLDIEKVF